MEASLFKRNPGISCSHTKLKKKKRKGQKHRRMILQSSKTNTMSNTTFNKNVTSVHINVLVKK